MSLYGWSSTKLVERRYFSGVDGKRSETLLVFVDSGIGILLGPTAGGK